MNTLATSLLFASVGVLLAWLLRRPARRLLGPGPAFSVWLLPLLLAATAWLPAWPAAPVGASIMPSLPRLLLSPGTHAAGVAVGFATGRWLGLLWLLGAGTMLARLVVHCWQLQRRSRPLPDTVQAAVRHQLGHINPRAVRLHPAGPAVCWLPRCRLLLPADLLQRFGPGDLPHVLAHERTHLARRDPLWSLLAELTLAALWFFPPAWLAMSRFRLDQELACDAAVLRQQACNAGDYARALLSGNKLRPALAATSPWLSQPQLKERLTMIRSHSRNSLKPRHGYAALATLLAGTALAAYTTLPANAAPPSSSVTPTQQAQPMTRSRSHNPPTYPASAIRNREQGTVVLLIHVSAAGAPLEISYDPELTDASTALIAAAVKAAANWRYSPARQDGRAVDGWVSLPVDFSLHAGFDKSAAEEGISH